MTLENADLRKALKCALSPCRHPLCLCLREGQEPQGIAPKTVMGREVVHEHAQVSEERMTDEEAQRQIRELFESLMRRGIQSVIIFAEANDGGVATGAVGPPGNLVALANIGREQLADMLKKSMGIGETG